MKTNLLRESSRGYDRLAPEDVLLSERKIFFTEEVTPTSAAELIQTLLCLDAENQKEITLILNSPGGDVSSGLAVWDVIMGLQSPVKTVVAGTAASMGAYLFLAGTERWLYEHSSVMLHDPLVSGMSGPRTALSLDKDAKRLMKARETLGNILAERTGHTLEEVLEKTREDCYLDAEEALDFGIATKIIDSL